MPDAAEIGPPAREPDPLTLHAQAQPTKTAVIEGDRQLDFAKFEALTNRYAHALVGLGVEAGTKVVWSGRNSLEVVTLIAAIRKAGGVGVPLNYRLAPEEASYVVANCDATVALFDAEQTDQLAQAASEVDSVSAWVVFRTGDTPTPPWAQRLDELAADQPTDPAQVRGEHLAAGTAMFYTSGTTGKPKGVVRGPTDPDLLGALVMEIGFRPDDVYLTTGPLYHSGPQSFMLIVQQLGGTVIVQNRFDPRRWLELVEQHRVTTTFSAPTPIRRVVDLSADVIEGFDTSSMQRLVANAAPWPFDLKRRYVEAFGEGSLFEVYGSTELGVDTILRPEDQMRKPGSCGRPAPGVEVGLFDVTGEQVTEPHEPGDLYVRSVAVFNTYYKADEKFEASRMDEWQTVGDIAYRDEEDFFYICDRRTDMIISGGVNIYPAEIEAVLVAHPAVADCAVFGIPSDEWGEQVHAALALYPDAEAGDADLDAHCRQHLASYKVPRSYSRLDEIPRNPSGKVLKRQLRDPFWEGRAAKVG